jgi:hypothetical protein
MSIISKAVEDFKAARHTWLKNKNETYYALYKALSDIASENPEVFHAKESCNTPDSFFCTLKLTDYPADYAETENKTSPATLTLSFDIRLDFIRKEVRMNFTPPMPVGAKLQEDMNDISYLVSHSFCNAPDKAARLKEYIEQRIDYVLRVLQDSLNRNLS